MTPIQSHTIRTFAPPALFAAATFFASTQRIIQYFPGATRNALLCAAGLSGVGIVGSGMLLSNPESDQRRRICIAASLLFSSLATYYGFKKIVPFKTSLRFAAAHAAVVVTTEVITTKSLQESITKSKENFSKNQNHMIRTLGTPALFAVAALFASTQRIIQYFPGATRKSLLCAAGLSGVGVLGSGMLLSNPESSQRRRICIAASLLFSSLATYYGFKKTLPLKTSLCFAAAQATVVVATEMITTKSLQEAITKSRNTFLGNRTHSHSTRTFVPTALFAIAALIASTQRIMPYFPEASRESLLCAAGLSGTGVVGAGMIFSNQESDQTRRICIAASLWLSSLATHYGFKKTTPLIALHRFSVIEAIIVVATEILTSGGPKFPKAQLKSSLNYAVLSIGFPIEAPPPPRVAMTFCVDTSSSMTGENREADVKQGINDVLESALKVAQTIEKAVIEIAVVGFSGEATTICNPTRITKETIQSLKDPVNGYTSKGTTDLYKGLIKAVEQVEIMKSDATMHTLILLTDGEATMTTDNIQKVHQRLAAVNAQLFAVGIGKGHNKTILQTLAPETDGFEGAYIDTTKPGKNIVDAISSIYEQTMAVFANLELRSSQLGAKEWSVNGRDSIEKGSYSVCSLESTSEKTQQEWVIKIHGKSLSSSLDLSQLSFQLVFKDPEGKRGIISIPWKADTIIDPSIIAHA